MRTLGWASVLLVACAGGNAQPATRASAPGPSEPRADASIAVTDASADATEVAREPQTGCGCTDYADPTPVGTLPLVLDETSGLAASRKNRGVLYAHNDSGDTARIFALDEKGALLGEIAFGGATAVDWEDLAVGPCPAGSCVWVGDVGDNHKSRSDYALYRIAEPSLDGTPFAKRTVAAEKFPFAYPDGQWNCETVLVHPKTGEVFLVTKVGMSAAGVYRFPTKLVAGTPVTLEKVGAAAGTAMSLVTGGDISPCGDRVLLRTYFSLFEYAIPPGKSIAEALATAPTKVPVAKEPQGEAVAFRADGRGYFTAPEGNAVTLSANGCLH